MVISFNKEDKDLKNNTSDNISHSDTIQIRRIKELLNENNLEFVSENVRDLLDIKKSNNPEIFKLNANSTRLKVVQSDEQFRVILYIRLSVEDGDLQDNDVSRSIKNQLLMLLDECEKRKWVVVAIFCEEDITGADDNRPEWLKCLKFCECGNTEIVLCKSQSRFTRSLEMVEKYIHKEFVDWNIRFVGLVDSTDTSVKGNKKSRQIHALTNEWAVEDQSINTRATLEKLKKNGQYTGSFAPYGYLKDPNDKYHLIIDECAAKIIKMIFGMYKSGKGYHKICQILNQKKVLTPSEYKKYQGSKYYCSNAQYNKVLEYMVEENETLQSIANKYGSTIELIKAASKLDSEKINANMIIKIPIKTHWTRDTVRKILMDEVYIGTLVQGKVTGISYKNKKQIAIPKEKWIRVPHCHNAIIDELTWQIVSERFKNRGKSRVSKNGEINIFSKKVYCSCCGKSFRKNVYQTKDGKKYYLQCRERIVSGGLYCNNNRSVSLNEFEDFILNRINMKISEYYELSQVKKNYYEEKVEDNIVNDLKTLENEKININKNIDKKQNLLSLLYEDRANSVIDVKEFSILKNKNTDELKRLQDRINEIDKEILDLDKEKNLKISREVVFSKYKKLKSLNRVVIDEFIKKITIGPVDPITKEREMIIDWNIGI